MRRYGYAIRVGGDSEIAGALAAGIEKGTGSPTGADAPPPRCGREALGEQAGEAVRRVAMMQHTPEEWAEMTEEARVFYGGQRYMPWLAEKLLIVYALICYVISIGWRALMESLNM